MDHPYKKKWKFGVVDLAVLLIFGFCVYVFFHKMETMLDYDWNWKAVGNYLIYKDPVTKSIKLNLLLSGFISTLKISIYASFFAFILGICFGLMRSGHSFIQKFFGFLYVEVIRNIPSLVLVFIFYFFISSQILDKLGLDVALRDCSIDFKRIVSFFFTDSSKINIFISAVVTLAIYEGAYVTEIIKSGLASVPKGQWDAGLSTGLSKFETFCFIIIPQALRNVLSPLAGQFISTIKDSAIMSVISVQELTFQGMEIMSATFLTFEIWLTITLLYFVLTFSLSRFAMYLEKKAPGD